jgi:hypothetical protein
MLKPLIISFAETCKEIFYFTFVILFYGITFCLIGCELFAYRMKMLPEVSVRINFDNFGESLIAIIHFLLDEEWHPAMYDYMRSTTKFAVFFWIFIMTTGNLLIMKLFLAIFINNYMRILGKVEE